MISIIIINYNTFRLTVECLNSIISLTKCEYELILVDNASTEIDANKFVELFPRIQVIKNEANLGFSKGNNIGVNYAKGDYILLLNSDVILINDAIDLAYNKIKVDDTIGALTSQLIGIDGLPQQCSHNWSKIYKLLGCTFKLHLLFENLKNTQPNLQIEHAADYIWGTFFLFPRKILNIFPDNKLPETFFMYGEDSEWSYYIRKAGYRLLYFPTAKVLHYGGSSSKSTKKTSWENSFNNDYNLHLIIKGRLYTFFYYISLSAFYFSTFKKPMIESAIYILKFLLRNMLRPTSTQQKLVEDFKL